MSAADRLNEIDQRIHALTGKADALLSSDKPLTVEEREECDGYLSEAKQLKAERQGILDDAERRKSLESFREQTAPKVQPSKVSPNAFEVDTSEGLHTKEKPQKFASLGEQLQAIASTSLSGIQHPLLHGKYQSLALATGSAAAGVPSDGGYLIQSDFLTDLMSRMSAESMFSSIGPQPRTIPLSSNSDSLKINLVDETSRATGSRWGGIQVYWGAEGDSVTAKKPKFRQETLELKDLMGLAYISDKLLADTSAMEAIFTQAFSEEMAWMIDDSFFNGGAGKPIGIVGHVSSVSVAKETGQAAATVVYDNILKMWSRLWARSRPNAVWFVNQDVEPQLHKMFIQTGTGGYPAYMPPGGLSGAQYGTLMGRPVVAVEHCQTLGTVGDIILADPTQYIRIVKGGMQAASSIHVRFITHESTFRFLYRIDGQPMWNSPLTPANGTNTQSPFITLATRS